MGTPYVLSSDLVSAYPAKSLAIAQYIDGYKLDTGPVQNAQTGTTYQFLLTDTTKTVTANNAAASAYTVPPQASVVWEDYTTLRLLNLGAGVVTLTAGAGVTLTGTVAVSQYSTATLTRTGSNAWTITGNASGIPTSATATVATSQTTTSTSYTDLATAGPAVTLTTGTKALVIVSAHLTNSAEQRGYMGFAVSGATTLAASDTRSLMRYITANQENGMSFAVILNGLTAGSNTFTAKYRVGAGTGTFYNRDINVMNLES
jgi:hypothetical protein